MTDNVRVDTQSEDRSGDRSRGSFSPHEEFSSGFVESADLMIAFDERSPIATLQRKLRMGYNAAQRLYVLILTRRSDMAQDYRAILDSAWHHAMNHYQAGKINSEQTLQAYLYVQLNAALPDCTVFCGQALTSTAHGAVVPDVVVINRQLQIAVALEIEFDPLGDPVFKGGIAKLRAIGINGAMSGSCLLPDPKTGTLSEITITISEDCLLALSVVGRSDAKAVASGVLREALCVGGQDALAARFHALVKATSSRNSGEESAK